MNDTKIEFKVITKQQEVAFEQWEKQKAEEREIGIDILPFDSWYIYYCFENNLFSDVTNLNFEE